MQPLKKIYFFAGILMVVLGTIGVFLPLLPTVPFLLLAAWFFERSSPRFQKWLYQHPIFGPPIKQWKEHGSISFKAKCFAVLTMGFSFLLLFFVFKPLWWISMSVFIVISIFIITRPTNKNIQ